LADKKREILRDIRQKLVISAKASVVLFGAEWYNILEKEPVKEDPI
jgi:hypothetical protein